MLIIGCDYHPSMQYIAWCEEQSGQRGEQRLEHNSGEAEKFYRELKQRGIQVRVGLEASGHTRWFERLMTELGFELWIGDPAQIKAKRVRKQKTDRLEMAAFGLVLRLHLPGGHISIPAVFRYALMGSRRRWVASWILRRDHPSRPKPMICCFFSSFKTFAMLREATYPPAAVNVLDVPKSMTAFQVFLYGRFWVFTEAAKPQIYFLLY
jgi:hypothetical protein